jgi:hypothetical protein
MLRRRFTTLCAAICAAVGLMAIAAAPVWAIGYYNLPGSFCQCFGYGNGAGHHACLVLGPSTCSGLCTTNEVRLEYPPRPPYGCYGGGCGTMESGTWLDEPTMAPPAGPVRSPAPAAMYPQILR